MGRAHHVVAGLLVGTVSMVPDLALDRARLPIPASLLALPDGLEVQRIELALSAAGVWIDLFDVHLTEPGAGFTARAPRVSATLDGDVAIDRLDVTWVGGRRASETSRSAIDRIASLTVHDVAVATESRLWTRCGRIDLRRDGDRVRGWIQPGSISPEARVFVEIHADSIELDGEMVLDGTEVHGRAEIRGGEFEVEASADRADAAWILRHWPAKEASDAKRWIERRVVSGVVSGAHLSANERTFALEFDFSDLDARIPGVKLPIAAARGHGSLTPDDLTLDVDGARLGELTARGRVDLHDLHDMPELPELPELGSGARVEVEVDLLGPAAEAMALAPRARGGPKQVAGTVELHVEVAAPLDGGTTRVRARGRGHDLALPSTRLPGPLDRYALSRGNVSIAYDGRRLALEGSAEVNGVPMSIAWKSSGLFRAHAILGPAERRSLGLPEIDGLTGRFHLSVVSNEDGEMNGTIDLTPAKLEIPFLSFAKAPGAAAQARFFVQLPAPSVGSMRMRRFELTAGALKADGSLELDERRALSELEVRVRHLKNDFRLKWRPGRVSLSGASFDARALLETLWRKEAKRIVREPVDRIVDLDLDRVLLTEALRIERAVATVRYAAGKLKSAEGSARLGGTSLSFRGRRRGSAFRVSARTNDAGALARSLGIETSLAGGATRVDGVLSDDLEFDGRARLVDISIERPSVALASASVTSIRGILQLVRAKRIHFEKADVRFLLNRRRLQIAKAAFLGGPIGLVTRGEVDLKTRKMNLVARVAPLDDLNRFVRAIPLLGQALAPEGDGLLVAPSYSLEGKIDRPAIRLRPDSLIPSLFRRLAKAILGRKR